MNIKRIILAALLALMCNSLGAMKVSTSANDYVLEKGPKQFLGVTSVNLQRKSDGASITLTYTPQTPLRPYDGSLQLKAPKDTTKQPINSKDAETLYKEFTSKGK